MRMIEGENIVHYCTIVKEVVTSIHGVNGEIKDENLIRKVLSTALPIYGIREIRCTPSTNLTLNCVISRLTTFEMSKFDNYTPTTIESAFKS